MAGAIQQLDEPWGKPGLGRCLLRQLGEEAGGLGMRAVPLGDDRVAGCDGGGEVAPGDPIESERKVVGAKDHDRAEGAEGRADIGLRVENGPLPGPLAGRRGRLPKLIAGAGKFGLGQPRFDRQGGFRVGGGDQFGGVGVDELRVLIEEAGEAFPGPARRGDEGAVGRVNRLLNLAPRTDGKHTGQQLAGAGIDCLKRLLSDRGTPLTIDQHRVRRHRFTFQGTRMKEQGRESPQTNQMERTGGPGQRNWQKGTG